VSDGTDAGTFMVKEEGGYPTLLTAVNGMLFFTDGDSVHGRELWMSDGTENGAAIVKDIHPNGQQFAYENGSRPQNLTSFKGELYFSADDGVHGSELWKSDGTLDGTMLVKDVDPALSGIYFYQHQSNFTDVNGTLYFVARDSVHGVGLWKSDGTTDGTVFLKDFIPRPYYYSGYTLPGNFIGVNGMLYFTADDSSHGVELWRSDGTAAGTAMVSDLSPGNSNLSWMTNVNGTLYFSGVSAQDDHNDLWVVKPPPLVPGDFNRDGSQSAADLSFMMQALCGLPGYQARYGLSDDGLKAVADVNHDGAINNADIQAMLSLLIHAPMNSPGAPPDAEDTLSLSDQTNLNINSVAPDNPAALEPLMSSAIVSPILEGVSAPVVPLPPLASFDSVPGPDVVSAIGSNGVESQAAPFSQPLFTTARTEEQVARTTISPSAGPPALYADRSDDAEHPSVFVSNKIQPSREEDRIDSSDPLRAPLVDLVFSFTPTNNGHRTPRTAANPAGEDASESLDPFCEAN
jgi:ELWxxDGT repeat protein